MVNMEFGILLNKNMKETFEIFWKNNSQQFTHLSKETAKLLFFYGYTESSIRAIDRTRGLLESKTSSMGNLILTTCDGYNVYDGDSFFQVNSETKVIDGPVIAKIGDEFNSKNIKFKILMNAVIYITGREFRKL